LPRLFLLRLLLFDLFLFFSFPQFFNPLCKSVTLKMHHFCWWNGCE
jgi:hypothetical protein